MAPPLVSVLMPVYNAGEYLAEAIFSILTQTYDNFELIIINDGSTDVSASVIASFNDPRIRLFNQENRGLSTSLNRAIKLATGRYLARQDADDVSFPERFARQVEFMESHPDYCMVGTWSQIWVESAPTERAHLHPCENGTLKFNLLFDSYFVHSSVMLRKSVLDRVGFYTEKPRYPEDYDLWSRMLCGSYGKMANIPQKLVAYREVEGSICRSVSREFTDEVINISMTNLATCSGRETTDPAVGDLAALAHQAFHRISGTPDFNSMLAVMRDAAASINGDGSSPDQSVNTEIRTRYARIRKAYWLHCWQSFYGRVRALLNLSLR